MAYVALTSLMATLELQFLQPIPRLSLHDDDHQYVLPLFDFLSFLREFLELYNFRSAPRDLEIKIRDFALEAEDNIETQISNFLLLPSKHNNQEEASQQLSRTLQEAAQNAAQLVNITIPVKKGETERKITCEALTSLIGEIRVDFAASGKIRADIVPATLIESLIENLSSLQQFLEISNFHAAAVKDLATKIRDFAFNAKQDITNHSNDLRHSNKLLQTLQEVAENTAELLNSINNTINELEADDDDEANQTQHPPIPIPWLKHNNASQSVNVNVKGSSLRCSEDTIMVGRQNDVTAIMDRLFSSFGGIDLIPIIGMPGIGKTTLARRIFEDQLVSLHFEVKIWFTMPKKCNEIQIQRDLLHSITQVVEQHEFKDGRTLCEMVQECLKGRRYLIVLDDIWSAQHWKYIKSCFPSYYQGNRILLTTWLYEVAHYACPSKGNHHVMSLLDRNESWDLFCNMFPLEKYRAPRFESFRSHLSKVVDKCDGLPQAIVIVAERLSECKDNIKHELKKIEKEIELLGILDYSTLTPIYNQLPEYLKVCFLYLGIFPKRSEIKVKTLLRLWVAEGFVKPSRNKELEGIAYCYLKDLIDRNLVLISKQTFDGKIKTCRVHSVMHNICFREAQKDGILCAVNTRQLPRWSLNNAFANSCRWLSLCKHSFDYYVLFSLNKPRSVFFFQDNSEIFVPFKLLRVLAFVPSPFLQRVPMHLGDLLFLRYLSITQWFEGLNSVVSTNLNLQTLVVCRSDIESQLGIPTLHLPSTIWESPQLRHLELGALYTVDPPSVVKDNLQTLSWVGPTHCRKEVYSNFPNIKKLKIFCKLDLEPSHIGGFSSKHIILDNLGYLGRLESLTISVSVGCIVTFPERWMFPSQLKKLSLSGTNLSGCDLTIIGSLERLEVLKLENAFHKEVWRVDEGGFYGLKFLLLKDKKLKRLEAYRGGFPCLEHLVLRCCHYLEEIPSSFGEIFCLKSIELDMCSHPSIVASAKDIEEKLKTNFGQANFEIKIQEHIVGCDEGDVRVGKFEKEKNEEGEYDELSVGHMAGVGKFKSYIHKLKNKRWRNLFRAKQI